MQRQIGKQEGAITIYMSLSLAVLLSLFLTLIEGARSRAVELVAGCAVDLAVYSVFAEYHRELFQEYDLLFVDTSYGTSNTSTGLLQKRLKDYIEENLSDEKGAGWPAVDLTQTYLDDLSIEECSYATDEKGMLFLRQAVEFMKQQYGVGYLEDLQKELKKAEEEDLFTRDLDSEREANEGVLDQIRKEGVDTGEVDENGEKIYREAEFENPADSVNAIRSFGILSLVTDTAGLSLQAVNPDTLLSGQGIPREGDGLCGRKKPGVTGKLWFDLYIREHCGTFLHPKTEGVLQYQLEYILYQKNSDVENLKAAVNRLLLLRETANVVYLFSDLAKVGEAQALAASIATAAGLPILIEPLKISLLFAWAYAESLWDVKQLLAGKTIPLIKTMETWHYSLEGMLSVSAGSVQGEDGEGTAVPEQSAAEKQAALARGEMGYEEYLLMFLALQPEQTQLMRMMDIVQMDVRKNTKDYGFCLSDCMEYLTIEASVRGRRSGERVVRRNFSYD
ncbi:MAG: DUF5702 domain-containing protein [Lachnospiraceae bacterium]|nr:DUF5702 domain-containing protein [Lachnospiraceae bacterium]